MCEGDEEIVNLSHIENQRELKIHAFFGNERAACDLTLFA